MTEPYKALAARTHHHATLKKWLVYLSRFVLISIGVILTAWLFIYLYFRSHKNEILQKTTAFISNRVHGTVVIKDIGIDFPSTFPYVSVNLKDVSIRDSTFNKHHHELLHAEKFLLRTNPFKLVTGNLEISKVQVERGAIYIYEDSGGYSTANAFREEKNDDEKTNGLKKSFRSFRLIDMSVTMDKPFKKKLFVFDVKNLDCAIDGSGKSMTIEGETNLIVRSLAFNLEKGSFAEKQPLRGDFKLGYNAVSRTLSFKDVSLDIGKEPYSFTGQFNFDTGKHYSLFIDAPKAKFSKAAALLPYNIQRNIDSIEFDKTLSVNATINGQLINGIKPVVFVKWVVNNTKITSNFGTFDHANFTGFFYNAITDTLPHTGENSMIQLNNFTANYEGIDLQSKKVAVVNLKKPFLMCDLVASTDLLTLNNLLESESIEFNKGTINANVTYRGPVYDSATEAPNIYGTATIKDGALLYGPRQIRMENFNGDLVFKGADVYFKNVKASAQGNNVLLNIAAINLLALMNSNPSKAELNASIYATQIDIANFTTFLGERKKTVHRRKGRSKFNSMSSKIDRLLDQCNIRSHIDADKVIFKKFTATNFKSDIYLSNEVWALINTSLNHAGGSIKMEGSIRSGSKNYNPVKINAVMSNLDISKTFYAFNNFGLTSLSSKNLQGKLSSTINLNAALLEKADLVPSSLKGSVTLSLKDGELNNWEPLESMSVFLLKNRDFSHVTFSEIKNTFDFNGRLVNINRMEIQSSVLSLFMEGLYDIGAKNTDLVIQVPLSNLKKRKPDYVPENKGIASKTGASIFVKAKNKENGDIDFSYSLFNSRKNKKTSE
jgi:NurA-like 5'-3' nuclease